MTESALRELLEIGHLVRPANGEIVFSGEDPVFPTRYRVGAAGAAALGAVGIAATDLWSLRAGRPRQRICVALRATAAALRSSSYLRVNGAPPSEVWDPMSGFYPVAAVPAGYHRAGWPDRPARVLAACCRGADHGAGFGFSQTGKPHK